MDGTLRILRKADDSPVFAREDSLWPAIAGQIDARRRLAFGNHFNGWVPAMAVAAACLLIALSWSSQPGDGHGAWQRNVHSPELAVYEDQDGRLYIDPSWANQHQGAFNGKQQPSSNGNRSWNVQFPSGEF